MNLITIIRTDYHKILHPHANKDKTFISCCIIKLLYNFTKFYNIPIIASDFYS